MFLRMRSWVSLVVVVVMLGAGAADAKKRRCKKTDYFVPSKTAVLGGPALGFETIKVTDRGACYRVLKATEDGLFGLIQLEKNKVGWVPLGLVDKRLSEKKKAKPVPVEEGAPIADKAFALRETPLRTTPRFDGKVKAVVAAGTELKITGRSPDGLWRYAKGKKVEGWVPRYQLTDKPIEKGAKPTAGEGEWSVRDVDRRTTRGKRKGGAAEPAEEKRPPLPVVRGHEVYGVVHPIARWAQRYTSDAQNDPFFKYDLQSLSGGFGGGYGFRSDDIPVVADARLDFDMFRFTAAAPGGQPQDIGVLFFDVMGRGGYPLLRSDDLDLEAGLGAGASTYLFNQLEGAEGAFTGAMYVDARPYMNARVRVGGGHLGTVSTEASLAIGGFYMLNDPGFLDPNDPELKQFTNGPRPGDEPIDPDAPAELGSPWHMAVGVDLLAKYAYPVGEGLSVDCGVMLKARQAMIVGPGRRFQQGGFYSEAANTDFIIGLVVGMTYGL
jgi:hypothetical protein